jgi:hypothetical protein
MAKQKKYWCPTHPEVQSDDPDAICTKCGTMKLVPREQDEHPYNSSDIKVKTSLKDFIPLVTIFTVVIGLTLILNYIVFQSSPEQGMRFFMGIFFIVFGGFKAAKLKGFAEAYPDYDLIAMHSKAYAYAYPFIELGLGILYIAGAWLLFTNIATLIIMSIGALGVYLKLRKGEKIICACLGVIFKIPMTWVTLLEDLVMVVMSLIMLIIF